MILFSWSSLAIPISPVISSSTIKAILCDCIGIGVTEMNFSESVSVTLVGLIVVMIGLAIIDKFIIGVGVGVAICGLGCAMETVNECEGD